MNDAMPLGPGAEFDAIRRLLERWGPLAAGIGDDAAVLRPPRGDLMVVSVDSSIEGRHFEAGWLSAREIGYRAVAAALSDLAAMAARPLGVLIALGVPGQWRAQLDELADGIGEAVGTARTHILGGNLSGAGELSISTTVVGSAYAPLARNGAKPGDRVYVTGRLGAPGWVVERLRAGEPPGAHRERFARPTPRLAEARWAADGGASAAIDISDGLGADARHVAAASGVSLDLDGARIPCVDGVSVEIAVRSGEEYELLLAAPRPLDCVEFEARFGIPLTEIGRVGTGTAGTVRISGVAAANVGGWNHFSS